MCFNIIFIRFIIYFIVFVYRYLYHSLNDFSLFNLNPPPLLPQRVNLLNFPPAKSSLSPHFPPRSAVHDSAALLRRAALPVHKLHQQSHDGRRSDAHAQDAYHDEV